MSRAKKLKAQKAYRKRNKAGWKGYTDEDIRALTPEKTCSRCGRTLSCDHYRVSRTRADGLMNYCDTCNVLQSALRRGKKYGVPADLTWEDVGDSPDECPCCGEAMVRGREDWASSPSLDRLIPELGYVPGNVVWVCQKCNTTKSDHSLAHLYRVADFYWEAFKERGLPLPDTQNRRTLEG